MSATRRLADLLRSEKCQPHAFVKPPVHHATPLPESLQVTLKYSPSSVAAADRPFIHFFQSTAELPLLPRRRQARRGNHTKVCDGKTCAGLAQNPTATINAGIGGHL